MQQYLKLLRDILDYGVESQDRTGTGTISIFGYQNRYDLRSGFPLLTTKKVFMRGITHELLWFLRGETNIRYLVQNDVKIWNEWPFQHYLAENSLQEKFPKYSEQWHAKLKEFIEKIKTDAAFAAHWGELGPVYGRQWRNFNGVDQIEKVIAQIRTNPFSRRLIVSAWNPAEVEEMARAGLPPCHTLFQFYVRRNALSCQLYQRSADVFLGVPFNIASYALLTWIVAKLCDLEVSEFVHTFGDAHIYLNHLDAVHEQLERQPGPLPQMRIHGTQRCVEDFRFEDFELVGYRPQPAIRAPISV